MANNLQRVISFPTPELRDILFWEEKDGTLAKNQNFVYGEPHPDATRYPNHKLVYVSSAPTEDAPNLQRWFYVANRVEQEAHNWLVSYPYAGLKTCPRFTCLFIIPEEGFVPLDRGTAHPLDLGDLTPTANLAFVGAKLMFEREVEVPQEIASLYKAVQRVYDKVPSVAEQLTHNIETTYPYAGITSCPRYVRTLVIPRATYVGIAKGTADAIHTSAKLIHEEQIESKDEIIENLYIITRRVYDEIPTIAEQEAYNHERDYPYQGSTVYPRVIRKYVVPRADLDTAVIPSVGLSLTGYTLAYRKQDRFEGQAEDSLYVLVTLAHDKIPNLTDSTDLTFLKGFGYQISRPYGTDDHPRVTWRIPAVKAGYTPAVDYAACPIIGYTGLLLTDESVEAGTENGGTLNLVRVYDSLPGPELEMEIREKFADVPEGFIIERTVEQIRQPVKNDASITALNGDAPDAVGGAIIKSQLGADGSNSVIWEKGTTRVTFTLGPRESVEYDEETGKVYDVTEEVVDAGTAGSDLNASTKLFSVIRALNQYFSIKTTRKATTLGTGGDARTWSTIMNWGWPAVLQGVNFFAVDYRHKDTGLAYLGRFGYDILMKEGYEGPCSASITESWSVAAQTPPTVVQLLPTAIEFDFPMTRNFSIPRCLHPEVTLTETVGSNHPELMPATTTKTFAATNYTDWPATIIASAQQTPYRGGHKMRVITISQPA